MVKAKVHWKYKKRIEEARTLQVAMEALCDQQGRLLDPILDRAECMDITTLEELVNTLPPGFHRCEIRGILRRKKENQNEQK